MSEVAWAERVSLVAGDAQLPVIDHPHSGVEESVRYWVVPIECARYLDLAHATRQNIVFSEDRELYAVDAGYRSIVREFSVEGRHLSMYFFCGWRMFTKSGTLKPGRHSHTTCLILWVHVLFTLNFNWSQCISGNYL